MSKKLFGNWVQRCLAGRLSPARWPKPGSVRTARGGSRPRCSALSGARTPRTSRQTAATWRREPGLGLTPNRDRNARRRRALGGRDAGSRAVTGRRGGVYIRKDEPTTAVGWKWPLTVGLLSDRVSRQYRDLFARAVRRSLVGQQPDPAGRTRSDLRLGRPAAAALRPGRCAGDHAAALACRCAPTARSSSDAARRRRRGPRVPRRRCESSVRTAGVALVPETGRSRSAGCVGRRGPFAQPVDRLGAPLRLDERSQIKAAVPHRLGKARRVLADCSAHQHDGRRARELARQRRVSRGQAGVRHRAPPRSGVASAQPRRRGNARGARGRVQPRDRHGQPRRRRRRGGRGRAAPHQPAPPAEPRFIQAQVFRRNRDRADARLSSPAWNIGSTSESDQSDASWLGPSTAQPFPDHELPVERDEPRAPLVFVEAQAFAEPQEATVTLPRRGPSSTCRFVLSVPAGHRSRRRAPDRERTATACSRRPFSAASSASPITLTIEAVVRPAPAGLDDRRRFDAAVVVHHDAGGTPSLTKLASGQRGVLDPSRSADGD